MRFHGLADRPLHHDEGSLWASFTDRIFQDGQVKYYPGFSGLTSWYLSAIPFYFMDVSVFSLRLMAAAACSGIILLLYPLRRQLGDAGLLSSALFLAVSPSMVYYSRQVTQYPFFIFFLMLCFVSMTAYFNGFRNRFLYLSAVGLGLLVTTHDLALIFFTVIASYVFFLFLFDYSGKHSERLGEAWSRIDKKAVIIAFILFSSTVILIMSCFLKDFSNLPDFVNGFSYQFKKSYTTGHNKVFTYYFSVFAPLELPVFMGCLFAILLLRRDYFSVFTAYWAYTSFLVYSLVNYKIPWMFIIVLLPMFILTGLTVDSVFTRLKEVRWLKLLTAAFLILLAASSLNKSIIVNYMHPMGRENKLNYVGPTSDLDLLIDDLSEYLSSGSHRVLITTGSYHPLSFYLRDENVVIEGCEDIIVFDKYPGYDVFIADREQVGTQDLGSFEQKEYELRLHHKITVLYRKDID